MDLVKILFIYMMIMNDRTVVKLAITADQREIDDTFKLLDEMEEQLELVKQHEITFVLGKPDPGKSYFFQWITQNSNEDSQKIPNTVLKLVSTQNNGAYYEPDFNDTRSVATDIATTYFMYKLITYQPHLRIIFTMNYSSVSNTNDTQDFLQLMRYTTSLVKNIEKYLNTTFIAITMAPEDEDAASIVDYLNAVHKSLDEKIKKLPKNAEERIFYEKTLNIISWLTVFNVEYDQIVIVPSSGGDKDEDARDKIKTRFVKTDKDDFNFTLSGRSKKLVDKLINEIGNKVWDDVSRLADLVQEHYKKNVFDKLRGKLDLFGSSEVEPFEAEWFHTAIRDGNLGISRLVAGVKHVTDISELSSAVKKHLVNQLGIIDGNVYKSISRQRRYFEFLKLFSNQTLEPRPWWQLLQKIERNFTVSKNGVDREVFILKANITGIVDGEGVEIEKAVENYYRKLFNRTFRNINLVLNHSVNVAADEAESVKNELKSGRREIVGLVLEFRNSTKVTHLSNAVRRSILDRLKITACKENIEKIARHAKHLDFLHILSYDTYNISQWRKRFQKLESLILYRGIILDNRVATAARNMSELVEDELIAVAEKITAHFTTLYEKMYKTINSVIDDVSLDEEQNTLSKNFKNDLSSGRRSISQLIYEIENNTDLPNVVKKNVIDDLSINSCHENIKNLENLYSNFKFLQIFNDTSIVLTRSPEEFKNINAFLSKKQLEFDYNININVKQISEFNVKYIKAVAKSIQEFYTQKINSTDIDLMSAIHKGILILSNATADPEIITLYKTIKNSELGSALPSAESVLLHNEQILNFMKTLTDQDFVPSDSTYLTPLLGTKKFLVDLEVFMKFVKNLDNSNSQYRRVKRQVTEEVHVQNCQNVVEQLGKEYGISYSQLMQIAFNNIHVTLLNNFLRAVKNNITVFYPTPGHKILHGDFVYFSDFLDNCNEIASSCNFTRVDIFAMRVVYIDADIYEITKFNVIAPEWQIIGKVEIDVGEFFGVGQTFVNGSNLTIKAKGGNVTVFNLGSASEEPSWRTGLEDRIGFDNTEHKIFLKALNIPYHFRPQAVNRVEDILVIMEYYQILLRNNLQDYFKRATLQEFDKQIAIALYSQK